MANNDQVKKPEAAAQSPVDAVSSGKYASDIESINSSFADLNVRHEELKRRFDLAAQQISQIHKSLEILGDLSDRVSTLEKSK